MTPQISLLAGIAALAAVQVAVLALVMRRLRQVGGMQDRIGRLADALTLLADTSEAGLTTLIREVERLSHMRALPAPASRTTVARRVVEAAARGESVSRIAIAESLSESEVRLHLSIAHAQHGGGAEGYVHAG